MFRIFQRTRNDLLSKKEARGYLLYATGELLLVIVGILIALQINNWNEERKEHRQTAEYARALVDDLRADIEMVEPILEQTLKIFELSQGLASYVRDRSIGEIDNLHLLYLTHLTTYRPYAWNRAALQQLMNSGALRQIKNAELVRQISDYDALTRHLDEDYSQDLEKGDIALQLAYDVVDRNYPNTDEIESLKWMTPYSFPPRDLHEAYGDIEVPLLTDDVKKIKVMVNRFGDLASSVRTRHDEELPTLQDTARSLIELLQREYPE
jgi:hypothetical protein